MPESNAELMTDYLDDALEGGEAESFAKLLADSPEAAKEAEALKRMLSLVRELPPVEAPPDFYEKLAKKLRKRRGDSLPGTGFVLPLQVISIIVIMMVAATYLMLEFEREDAKVEKDPTVRAPKSNE